MRSSGKEVWSYTVASGRPSTRGVAYWPGDKQNPPRIIFTAGRNLIALNANTGKIDPGFGKEGIVDMVRRLCRRSHHLQERRHGGRERSAKFPSGRPGDTRAYDARTGAKLWDFHTVPQPGEVGHDTWLNDGWKGRSGTNVWAWHMTVDEQRGILYMPIGGPASNYYGGDRPGANLFGNSLVAVDAETGKLQWYFQTVHHDLWDYDTPPAPVLVDITVNGKKIPALAQIGKTGWMFILNRETGKPVFGVEERKVTGGRCAGRVVFAHAAVPVEASAAGAHEFQAGRYGDGRGHHARARHRLARSWSRRAADSTTPVRSRRSSITKPARRRNRRIIFPGATGGTIGAAWPSIRRTDTFSPTRRTRGRWAGPRRRSRAWSTRSTSNGSPLEYTRAGVDGPGPFHTFTRAGERSNGARRQLALPETTMGPADRGEREYGRVRVAGSARHHRRLGPAGKQNTGRPEDSRAHRDGGRTGVHRRRRTTIASARSIRRPARNCGRRSWTQTANANPMTYEGKDGKQYVAIVSG